jgi:hypothetical protein
MNKINILIESDFLRLFYSEKQKLNNENFLKKEVFDKVHCLLKTNTTGNFNRFINQDVSTISDNYLKHLAINFQSLNIAEFESKRKEIGCVVFTTNNNKEYKKTHNQLIITIDDLIKIDSKSDQIGIEKYFSIEFIYVENNSKFSDIYDYKFHFFNLMIIDQYLLEKCENSDKENKLLYENTSKLIFKLFKIKNNQNIKIYLNYNLKRCISELEKLFKDSFFKVINLNQEESKINFNTKFEKDIHNRNILSDFLIVTSEHGFNLFREDKAWRSIITILPIFHYNNRKNTFDFFDIKNDIKNSLENK